MTSNSRRDAKVEGPVAVPGANMSGRISPLWLPPQVRRMTLPEPRAQRAPVVVTVGDMAAGDRHQPADEGLLVAVLEVLGLGKRSQMNALHQILGLLETQEAGGFAVHETGETIPVSQQEPRQIFPPLASRIGFDGQAFQPPVRSRRRTSRKPEPALI